MVPGEAAPATPRPPPPRMPVVVRAVRQPDQPTLPVLPLATRTPPPPCADHPIPAGDLGHLRPAEHLHHRVYRCSTTLATPREHQPGPLPLRHRQAGIPDGSVTHQVEPERVTHQNGKLGQQRTFRSVRTFFAWPKAAAPPRRRGTPRWGPALRAALARRPRAPHRTPHPHHKSGAYEFQSTALNSDVSTFYGADDGRGPRVPHCQSAVTASIGRLFEPWAGPPRTGIAAGHHRGPHPQGHCADPRGHPSVSSDRRTMALWSRHHRSGASGGPRTPFQGPQGTNIAWHLGGTPV